MPTLNERQNIPILVERLHSVLRGREWEVLFVDDDSPDGTAEIVRAIAQTDRRVRCLQRIGRRGLSSACIEGILATSAPVVAVMDADLQHDETVLPRMLAAIQSGEIELAVGSRYVAGGSTGDWQAGRERISSIATRLSRLIVRDDIADPMSGFFMVRRTTFERAARNLSGQGFKILLDLFASSPQKLRFREFPFRFRARQYGQSKLDAMVAWEYLMLIADKLIGGAVPARFVLFAGVGALGIVVNLLALRLFIHVGIRFALGETLATLAAIIFNFFVNNVFTYHDRRLRGWRLMRGLIVFAGGCALGAAANVGVAWDVFGRGHSWWLAGLSGAAVGAVWNYAIASTYTWGNR